MHPRWLSDNNDGTELWPDNLPKQSSQDEMEMVQDEVVIEEPAPIDFDWVEETEETSNCGDIILEQDIPASLEEEVVTNSGTEADYDDNSDASSPLKREIRRPNTVSTSSAEEGVLPSPPRFISINPRSLLKRHYIDVNEQLSISCQPRPQHQQQPQIKFKQTLMVQKTLFKGNQQRLASVQPLVYSKIVHFSSKTVLPSTSTNVPDKSKAIASTSSKPNKPTTKFKKCVTLMDRNVPQNKNFQAVLKKLKQRKAAPKQKKYNKKGATLPGEASSESGLGKSSKRGNKLVNFHGENITINHEADKITENPSENNPIQSVPIKVKIEKIVSFFFIILMIN